MTLRTAAIDSTFRRELFLTKENRDAIVSMGQSYYDWSSPGVPLCFYSREEIEEWLDGLVSDGELYADLTWQKLGRINDDGPLFKQMADYMIGSGSIMSED